jgi:TatD DNase family protein
VIDTHAHLDACPDPPDVLVARARAAGVTRILTVGTTLERCRTALELADANEEVYAILGIHPHEAGDDHDLGALRELLAHPKAVAVGETGLDYYRDYAPHDRQRALFEAQLALASELGRTVVVHSRAADDDTLDALAGFTGPVVLHCFTSARMLRPALDRGYYVSFAGNVTYKNAPDLRVAASQVPAERLLAETDCPYLAPQPLRGRSNEPAYVVHTYAALAAARGADVAAQVDANAATAFGL